MNRLLVGFGCTLILVLGAGAIARADSVQLSDYTWDGSNESGDPFGIVPNSLTATFADTATPGQVTLTLATNGALSYTDINNAVHDIGLFWMAFNVASSQEGYLTVTAANGNPVAIHTPVQYAGVNNPFAADQAGNFSAFRLQFGGAAGSGNFGQGGANQTDVFTITSSAPGLLNADSFFGVKSTSSPAPVGPVYSVGYFYDPSMGEYEDNAGETQKLTSSPTPEPTGLVGLSGMAGMLLLGLVWRRGR